MTQFLDQGQLIVTILILFCTRSSFQLRTVTVTAQNSDCRTFSFADCWLKMLASIRLQGRKKLQSPLYFAKIGPTVRRLLNGQFVEKSNLCRRSSSSSMRFQKLNDYEYGQVHEKSVVFTLLCDAAFQCKAKLPDQRSAVSEIRDDQIVDFVRTGGSISKRKSIVAPSNKRHAR